MRLLALALCLFAARADEGVADAERLPHLCVTTWRGPTPACSWHGSVEATGAGRTQARARKASLERLRVVLLGYTRAAWISAQGPLGPAKAGTVDLEGLLSCARSEELEVSYTCIAQPALARERTCYANLTADPCWTGGIRAYEGPGWWAQEEARQRTCAEVGEAIQARSEDLALRLRCEARCLSEVRILCN